MLLRKRNRRRRRLIGLAVLLFIVAIVFVALITKPKPPTEPEVYYPMTYRSIIEKCSQEFDLDPAHVAAVIFCESTYRPEALSYADARGLMQIVPKTGKWIAEKLGDEENYSDDKLFDPETNIRYGCWFLSYLNQKYDGDIRRITAAYHAGEGTVAKWLKDSTNSDDGINLENIPSDVTGDYVTKVLKTYEIYKELYAQPEPSPTQVASLEFGNFAA